MNPKDIIEIFLRRFAHISDPKEQVDTIFRIIQFVEREVVLFDSIEDSNFVELNNLNDLEGTLSQLYQQGKQQRKIAQIKKAIRDFKVRLVFTAHPTQFYPNTVLRIISELTTLVSQGDLKSINNALRQLGKTPFMNKHQPTPLEEADSIIYYLRYVYYNAIGDTHQTLYKQYYENNPFEFEPVLEMGFWPGGDRDGNPFVTAQITKKVTNELRNTILKCYYHDLKSVVSRLTFKNIYEPLNDLLLIVYNNTFNSSTDLTYNFFLESLDSIRKTLIREHNGIFLGILDRFILQVKTFKLHFASLDIRQDSSIHFSIFKKLGEKFQAGSIVYDQLTHNQRLDFLFSPDLKLPENGFNDPVLDDTIENIKQIKEIHQINGKLSIHRYIISNSTTIFSVLEVISLFRLCGYRWDEINIDFVPLFETIEGLNQAEKTLQILYNLKIYKEHLSRRNKIQTIMLGFSDGTKDGGYLKANWEIYRAKEVLTKLSREHNVEVVFFDGRGGPPSRGGGKTRQFYASQGETISSKNIQLTIQGQTISSSYGSNEHAKHNFEQLITAGIHTQVFPSDLTKLSVKERKIIEELAELSFHKYEKLKNNPMFIPYLETVSTVEYYGKTNIGSRPTKRANSKGLQLDGLRAIPFVGAWSQLKQNIPGFYGLGYAFQKYIDKYGIQDLKDLVKNSLYFDTLIQNSMMSMIKSNFRLTSYLKDDPKFSEFWNDLHDEFQLACKIILEITGQKELMENDQLNRLSVLLREKIVLPLLIIQQYAVQKIHQSENPEEKRTYEKMLIRTMHGIINASRNSA